MKTTLELPDPLMRQVKIRAAQTDRKLKDVVAELIQRGLASPDKETAADDPVQAWLGKLVTRADGTVANPDGIDDPAFFQSLEDIREQNLHSRPRDPFADMS